MPKRTRSRKSQHVAVGLVLALSAGPLLAQQPSLGVSSSLTAAAFKDQVGRRITYVCPPTDIPPDVSVWGTDVYTFDSAVCLAAIHAGVLQRQSAGIVTFTMGPGAAAFRASTRNGVTSKPYTSYESTFKFDTSGEPGRLDGRTTLRVPAGFAGSIVVTCPPTGDFPYSLWGTDIYADDSSICAAAVHANLITAAAGGPVTVTPAGAQNAFQGSSRNGVKSENYTAWPTSFRVAAGQQTAAPVTAILVNPITATPAATAILSTAPAAASAPPALPANASRYRVILLGATVQSPTKDIRDNADGIGDEIYGAAVTMLWDRRTNVIARRAAVRTVEYGDTNAIRKAANRIRAGTGGPGGGLVANNIVPNGFIPGQSIGEPQTDRFPLLVWEGVLTDGIDGLLVVPSLWERDATGFADYESRWLTGSPSQTLTLVLPNMIMAGLAVNEGVLTPVPHLYTLTDLAVHIIDRPLGLTPQPLVVPYRDRFFVITREKLTALTAVGSTAHLSITYAEPAADPVLGGNYTLSVRVERTQ